MPLAAIRSHTSVETEVAEGAGTAEFVFIAEFDDAEAIHTRFRSDKYREQIPFRDAGFESIEIYTAENN